MPSFEISEKELFISVLKKSGVPIITENDGSRWVDIDLLYEFFNRRRSGELYGLGFDDGRTGIPI